jgi:hypothetical protein
MISLEVNSNINHILCDDFSLRIINLEDIVHNKVIPLFLNECYDYCIEVSDYTHITSDMRRILQHTLIFEMCDYILKHNSGYKNVLYFHKSSLDIDIPDVICNELSVKIVDLIAREVRTAQKVLPLVIHTASNSGFNRFYEGLNEDSGYLKSKLSEIYQKVLNNSTGKFTFEKCKKIYNKNGLIFLSNEYFNNIKTKMALVH